MYKIIWQTEPSFEISSEISTANCPYCGKESKRIHSRYQREIQDLPIQGKKVVLLVSTRKFFCDNDTCCKWTFSERHTFVDANGKRTKRLEKNLFTSSQLSSINASKVLKNSNVDISKSSICVLLKKMPSIVDNLSVRIVCVDDFAIRKDFLLNVF